MKKNYFLVLVCICSFQSLFSQTVYKMFNSAKLGEERELKIQLPRNYEKNLEKRYPLILVLDGDYLFEPMAGLVDYYSYWDEIPEAIVVGVNQNGTRNEDCQYDEERFLPFKKGAQFFEFLGMELLPFLETTYRTSRFTAIAGHDVTANFINYYLYKKQPLFNAYINLSPDLAPESAQRLASSLGSADSPKWFYLATAKDDYPQLKEGITALHQELSSLTSSQLHYFFDDFESGTHYSMIGQAIPRALEQIFKVYPPLSVKDYDAMVAAESSPLEALLQKYQAINDNYGLEKRVRLNDFLAVGKAIESLQKWDELEKLGDLAREQYPHSTLGTYYLARSYEASGRPKKAMKTYKSAYGQEEVAFITVDFMLDKAKLIEEDFGY